jgi:hypothetical protein
VKKKFVICLALFCSPVTATAQIQRVLPAGDLIPRIVGDQREPRLAGKLLATTQGPSLFGDGIEGEAGIGRTFPVYLFSGSADGDYVVLAMGAGVWGRFNMKTAKKHFISSDWNFRLPVIIRRGNTRLALSYNHISSHLGDEYIDRFNAFTAGYSIDNLRAIWFQSVGRHAEVYGGGTFAVNVTPGGSDRLAVQFGAQLQELPVSELAEGFVSLDVSVDQNADWDPRFSMRSGITFLPENPNRFSVVLELLTGPSPQGEFLKNHETFIAIGVQVGY